MISVRIKNTLLVETMELTLAFAELGYAMFEDYCYDYGYDTILYIQSKNMYKDPKIRSLLLEYMI